MATESIRFNDLLNPVRSIRSLWLQQALALEDGRNIDEPASLPATADVVVVGGGYTGLWTAIQTKRQRPGTSVVLLEGDICGSGASGRNGGFILSAWSKFGSLRQICGTSDAVSYALAAESAIDQIGAFCAEHDINAEFRQDGWLWAATNASQVGAWEATVEELDGLGVRPFKHLTADEVHALSGSQGHLAGVFDAKPATVQPALLARGLARVARQLGIEIFEHTTVRDISAHSTPVVRTDRGSVAADRVVLASGAWSAAVASVRRSLIVVASDVVVSAPIPERLEQLGWRNGLAISDSRRLVNYYRLSKDGRVVFGKGGGALALGGRIGATFHRASVRSSEVEEQFKRLYPSLWDVPVPLSWRGPVDYSMSGLPFVGPLDSHPAIFVAAGFSGNGLGPSYVAGGALADMVLTGSSERMPEALQRQPRGGMPPEPFRFIGGLAVRGAVARKEMTEDRGLVAGRGISLVASMDPTSFIDRK